MVSLRQVGTAQGRRVDDEDSRCRWGEKRTDIEATPADARIKTDVVCSGHVDVRLLQPNALGLRAALAAQRNAREKCNG